MSGEPQLYRINPLTRESVALQEVEFARLGLQERRDIQEWIAANPGIMGEDLLVISKEFSGFDRTSERLDLLAVDANGRLVVIELKRDDSGSDAYWQAIKYASYIRRASANQIISMLASHAEVSEEEAGTMLLNHLDSDGLDSLNSDQRIILASHRFAPEVTSAALWLNEKAPDENLITCIQLTPYRDEETDSLYVQANTIIPVPGEEDYQVQIGSRQFQGDASGFAQKLQRTYERNQRDDITRFLRRAADIGLSSLTKGKRPDKRSKWAGGWAGGAYDHRYYRVWYSHAPWSNWGMSYRMNLYRLDSETDPWKVNVEFGHFSDELGSRIAKLQIHESQEFEDDRVMVTHTSEDLDDAFSHRLGDTLRRFIEAITPLVDGFEEDKNQEESLPAGIL